MVGKKGSKKYVCFVRINPNGQATITIPKPIVQCSGIKHGMPLHFSYLLWNGIIMKTPEQYKATKFENGKMY